MTFTNNHSLCVPVANELRVLPLSISRVYIYIYIYIYSGDFFFSVCLKDVGDANKATNHCKL